MIRVVVTGPECTGKTTLARQLAAYYNASWVAEYARTFVQQRQSPPTADDVEAIATGQMRLEDEAVAAGPSLLILDTDLISTVVYARHYYGEVPGWIELEARRRRGDLYLLAGIDVPWAADGMQRDRPADRAGMQELFREALAERGATVRELQGNAPRRLSAAVEAIEALLDSA